MLSVSEPADSHLELSKASLSSIYVVLYSYLCWELRDHCILDQLFSETVWINSWRVIRLLLEADVVHSSLDLICLYFLCGEFINAKMVRKKLLSDRGPGEGFRAFPRIMKTCKEVTSFNHADQNDVIMKQTSFTLLASSLKTWLQTLVMLLSLMSTSFDLWAASCFYGYIP